MCGRIAGIYGQRIGGLVDSPLGKAEGIVVAREAGAARGAVLVEQVAPAINRAVVVERDRLVQFARRFDRTIFRVQAQRIE